MSVFTPITDFLPPFYGFPELSDMAQYYSGIEGEGATEE